VTIEIERVKVGRGKASAAIVRLNRPASLNAIDSAMRSR